MPSTPIFQDVIADIIECQLSGADEYASLSYRIRFYSSQCSYVAKPFQRRELVARVHLQMQLGKRRAELEVRSRLLGNVNRNVFVLRLPFI